MDGYISGAKVKELFDVSDWTLRHWADTGKIKSLRTPEDSDDMIYQHFIHQKEIKNSKTIEKSSAMPEYPLGDKRTTSSDRSISSNSTVPRASSSQILPPASTGNAKILRPFWNSRCKEISEKLSWPQGTVFADSHSTSSNGCLHSTTSASRSLTPRDVLQSRSCPTTSLASCRSFAVAETENVGIPENPIPSSRLLRMRKIKLNPTKTQKLMLNKYADSARFTYNACVSSVNDKIHTANKFVLRNAFVTAKNNPFFEDKKWILDTPKVIRQQAVFEVAKNFKSAFTNKRNGNIDRFKMTFKTLKHQRASGYVLGIERAVKFEDDDVPSKRSGKLTILSKSIGPIRFFEKPPITKVPEAECSIQRDSFGDFWLQVPVYKTIKPPNFGPAIAMDPGVRTPLSFFSPCGTSGFIGHEMKDRIDDIKGRVATVDRRLSKAEGAFRKKMLWHRRRLFRKYTHIRDDWHWKLIKDVTDNYGGVILPHLQSSRLCGSLKAKTNREMFGISHFTLNARMEMKCEERGVMFQSPTEEYTSKTCGSCGLVNGSLGSSEIFHCDCGLVCHRDLHAARNIYMKWYIETERGARALAAFDPLLASCGHPQES